MLKMRCTIILENSTIIVIVEIKFSQECVMIFLLHMTIFDVVSSKMLYFYYLAAQKGPDRLYPKSFASGLWCGKCQERVSVGKPTTNPLPRM